MRPRAWVIILALCAIMFICRVQISGGGNGTHADSKKAPAVVTKPTPVSPTTVRESKKVLTYGKTAEAAKQLALDGARDWVAVYLTEQSPPLQWRPDAEYLQQNKMVAFSDPETVRVGPEGHEEEFQQVTATVEVTNKTFSDMQEQDRKLRADLRKLVSKDRQTLLAKILAGVVATLAAVAIYLRLDDATKGYYSLWLRLGSVALVATVGAGAWMLL
jgi:hypothetical protein